VDRQVLQLDAMDGNRKETCNSRGACVSRTVGRPRRRDSSRGRAMASSLTWSLFNLKMHWPSLGPSGQSTSTSRWTKFRNIWIVETKNASTMGLEGHLTFRVFKVSFTLDNGVTPCVAETPCSKPLSRESHPRVAPPKTVNSVRGGKDRGKDEAV
jgi:hypothetical protein